MESSTRGASGLSGVVIGGYRLEDTTGQRRDTILYRGRRVLSDSALPEVAAVEVLSLPAALDLRQERALRERFQWRMEALRRLRHPHITPVLAWGEDESQPFVLLRFVVLPDVDGQRLVDRLARGPLPLREAAGVAAQVAEALDYAHAASVIHGAVTPEHILLDGEGYVSLTGFETDLGPELLSAPNAPADPPAEAPAATPLAASNSAFLAGCAADISALAAVLYEMVTGRSPVVSGDSGQSASTRGPGSIALPRALRPDLPLPAEAAIMRGVAAESDRPYASAGALVTAFTAGLQARRQEPRPLFKVMDDIAFEQQPTAPVLAVAPERPTAPLMPISPRTGQLIWGRRTGPRWFLVAALAVIVILALALVLLAGLGGVRPSSAPTQVPGASTTQDTTSPAGTLTPAAAPTARSTPTSQPTATP